MDVFAKSLELKLERAPAGLPPHLATHPLFEAQRVSDRGFQCQFRTLDGDGLGPVFRFSRVAVDVTRKTLLPAIVHYAGDLAPGGAHETPPAGLAP